MTLPTLENIFPVQWLGHGTSGPAGSGVIFHAADQNYLVTAKHLLDTIATDPRIFQAHEWRLAKWNLVAEDASLDVAILAFHETEPPLFPTQKMGVAGTRYGDIGRALGFPASSENLFSAYQGIPVPVPIPICAYVNPVSDIQIAGGYLNAGYSGGAVLLPLDGAHSLDGTHSLAGIITEKHNLMRPIVSAADESVQHDLLAVESTGIFQFTSMDAVLRLLGNAIGKDLTQRTE